MAQRALIGEGILGRRRAVPKDARELLGALDSLRDLERVLGTRIRNEQEAEWEVERALDRYFPIDALVDVGPSKELEQIAASNDRDGHLQWHFKNMGAFHWIDRIIGNGHVLVPLYGYSIGGHHYRGPFSSLYSKVARRNVGGTDSPFFHELHEALFNYHRYAVGEALERGGVARIPKERLRDTDEDMADDDFEEAVLQGLSYDLKRVRINSNRTNSSNDNDLSERVGGTGHRELYGI